MRTNQKFFDEMEYLQRLKGKPTLPWSEFIKSHEDVIAAADFFTTEVMTEIGLVTYYILFFMHLDTRRVHIAGIISDPYEDWMKQIARNLTMWGWGFLEDRRYVILDRDPRFSAAFREILKSSGLKIIRLPPYSPNLNSYAERWVLSVKTEVLSGPVLFDEAGLRKALKEYIFHFHEERNHQGKQNELLFPQHDYCNNSGDIKCKQRLGGLLKFYYRETEGCGADGNMMPFYAQKSEIMSE